MWELGKGNGKIKKLPKHKARKIITENLKVKYYSEICLVNGATDPRKAEREVVIQNHSMTCS